MKSSITVTVIGVGVALAILGCTKPETENPPSTTTSEPPKITSQPPKTPNQQKPPPSSTTKVNPITKLPVAPATTLPEPDFDTLTPQQQVQQLAKMEHNYRGTAELTAKIQALYDISGTGVPAALDTITRLFQTEHDAEMKQQMIDAIDDIDGENDRKLTLLSSAITPNQPLDVRESAIDALIDLEDPRAISILQALLNDPNEDIREAAQDAIDQLKESMKSAANP